MAASTTYARRKSEKKKAYTPQHKLWVRYLDGRVQPYYSDQKQDNDPTKLRAFLKRICGDNMHRIGIIKHYIAGDLRREYRSDIGEWKTPQEIAEYKQKLKEQNSLKDANSNPTPSEHRSTKPAIEAGPVKPDENDKPDELDPGGQPTTGTATEATGDEVHQERRKTECGNGCSCAKPCRKLELHRSKELAD